MSKEKLKKLIKEKEGYITTQDADVNGIHRQYLSLFVEEEKTGAKLTWCLPHTRCMG